MIKSMGKKISQSPEIMAFLLYSCSHFFILLNNGVYWDGWVLYESKKEGFGSGIYGLG